jgi:hypothetical protein
MALAEFQATSRAGSAPWSPWIDQDHRDCRHLNSEGMRPMALDAVTAFFAALS